MFDFPPISLEKLANDTGALFGVTLSTNSYSNLVIAMNNDNNNTSVVFSGGSSMLTSAGATAKQNLIDNKSWTIVDGGLESPP